MTRVSASPSGDPARSGGQGSRPCGVSMAATRRPNSAEASYGDLAEPARVPFLGSGL